MKKNFEEAVSIEALKARERNRIAAKKRRLKDRASEMAKQKEFELACQENQILKEKLEFLSQLKDLMNEIVNCYQEKNNSIDQNYLENLLDLESVQLFDLSVDFIEKIIPDENKDSQFDIDMNENSLNFKSLNSNMFN